MKPRRGPLPLLLGAATFVVVALLLWPTEEPTRTLVVAARDLGAGAVLAASDLTLATLPEAQAPGDAVDDPALLTGQTLGVVRFAGEPVTVRHLGETVTLAPDERGIAVRVTADTGLAGLLRPGMQVGVVATLPQEADGFFAKALLEDLRVLYVPPEFQARPSAPVTAQLTIADGESTYQPPVESAQPIEEGVLVLAASTQPVTVTYQLEGEATDAPAIVEGEPPPAEEESPSVRIVPVELLAALNAADAAFTLVLTPENSESYTTAGLVLSSLLLPDEEDDALAGSAP